MDGEHGMFSYLMSNICLTNRLSELDGKETYLTRQLVTHT